MSLHDHVIDWRRSLEAERGDIVGLTRALVAVESPTDHLAGVAQVVELLAQALAARGIATEQTHLDGCGPLLQATVDLGPGRRVLMLGHSDTVWPVGTIADWPFAEHDGLLTGPGVGDMKVCLSTAVSVLALLHDRKPEGLGRVTLLVVPDEETGSVSSRAAVEHHARTSDLCLTLEAARPDGGIVTSRGAVGAMTIHATGRSAHATDPGPQASALVPLARLVDMLEERPGVTVGFLRAGTARQVVPDSGVLAVDLRAETTTAAEQLADQVRERARAVPRPDGVAIEVRGGVTRPAWLSAPQHDSLFATASAAAEALGVRVQPVAERGGSDASFAGALGVPTIDGLGPTCFGSCSRAEAVPVNDVPVWGAILAAVAAYGVAGSSSS